MQEHELNAFYGSDYDRVINPGEIMVLYGHARKGFEYPLIKFAVITESDIFGQEQKKKKKKKVYNGKRIQDFAELSIGDYVVHEKHGLGIYRGIEKVEVDKVLKDYIKIEYRDGSNLYILATQLDALQKYSGADTAKAPKLNKLGNPGVEPHEVQGKGRCQKYRQRAGGALRCAPGKRRLCVRSGYSVAERNLRKCSHMRRQRIS